MNKKTGAVPVFVVFLVSAVFLAPGAPSPGAGPDASGAIVIKIGSIAPSRSPWDKALERVANDWERISNGAVEVRIYPGGIAGSEQDMIRKMRLGALQGGVFETIGLAKIDRSLTVLCLPFLFHSREEFNVVFEQMKPSLEKAIEAQGFKVILWTLAGWVNFFAKSPVIEPDDLKKHKISVTAGFPEIEQVWKRMGYEAVPGTDSELMIQVQSGAVTALYLPALLAGSGQYFALAPHMLSPSLAPLFGGLLLSERAWSSIPAGLHQPFLDAVAAASAGLYEETVRLEADAVKMMKENGLIVHDPSAEGLAKWRAAADTAIAALVGSAFSRDVYDQAMGHILAYRKSRGR